MKAGFSGGCGDEGSSRGRVRGGAVRDGELIAGEISRAEGKLRGALNSFPVDLRGKVVLDIGSSTGGFTKVALEFGAEKVIAIEKGTGQMKASLRFDPRVDLREKTDIFETEVGLVADLENKDVLVVAPEVILADVSFVSLRAVLKHVKSKLADKNTEFLVMLKPQFEAKKWQLRDGVLKNNKIRREIVADFEVWLKNNGFVILGKHDNAVAGKFGNVERFYYLKLAG